MYWQSFAKQFNFITEAGLKDFVEGVLFSVIYAFDGPFIGHAKCIVKTGGRTYYASTTAIWPEVEWHPYPRECGEIRGSVDVAWTFRGDQGGAPTEGEIEEIIGRYRAEFDRNTAFMESG